MVDALCAILFIIRLRRAGIENCVIYAILRVLMSLWSLVGPYTRSCRIEKVDCICNVYWDLIRRNKETLKGRRRRKSKEKSVVKQDKRARKKNLELNDKCRGCDELKKQIEHLNRDKVKLSTENKKLEEKLRTSQDANAENLNPDHWNDFSSESGSRTISLPGKKELRSIE